jgi:hypothetical protein
MCTPNQLAVRKLLREKPDGLSASQMVEMTGKTRGEIHGALRKMPDVYIDRWYEGRGGLGTAIWCAVVPPADCPMPDFSKKE